MAFVSLLWREVQSGAEPEGKAPMPDFFLDLNIDQLFKLIKDQAPGYDLSQMYYRFPQDEEETRYRREVYRDVKTPQIYECLEAFSKQMRTVAKALENRTAIEDQLQINAWHSTAAALYCRAVHLLWEQISQLPVQSQGLKQLTEDLCAYVQRKDFLELKKAACHIREQMENIRLILRIENNKITVTHGSLEGAYETFLGGEGGEQASPFAADMRMSPLEEEIFAVYRKKYPQLFRDIQQFSESFPAFGEEDIFRLEKELQYYLAFYRFQQKMESWNCCFTEPETDEGKEMEARDLYDLALAAE